MNDPISPTKFSPPELAPDTVQRTSLTEEFLQLPHHCKVLFLQAPAGYGKTTLMAQFFKQLADAGKTVGWVTLDESENDVTRYLQCLTQAISIARGQRLPIPEIKESHLAWLLEVIKEAPKPMYFFLDEFDLLREPAVVDVINRAFTMVPADIKIVLGCRGMPEVDLSKMLLTGEARRFDQQALRFQPDEAETFVKQRWGGRLTEHAKKALYQSTENWPAGMQLSYLACDGSDVNVAEVASSLHQDPLFSHYVLQNVLSKMPQNLSTFLLTVCCLNRLTAPICNALVEINNSQDMLNKLVQQGLFIRPVDHQHQVFELHKLFAELLSRESKRQYPGLYENACRKAALWCDSHDQPEEAINYAFAAGDQQLACQYMEKHIPNLLFEGRIYAISRWTEQIDKHILLAFPNIIFAGCWAYLLNREFSKAQKLYRQMERFSSEKQSALPTDGVTEITKATFHLFRDEMSSFRQCIDKVHDRCTGEHSFAQIGSANLTAYSLLSQGQLKQAGQWMKTKMAVRRQSSNLISNIYFDCIHGMIYLLKGQLETALTVLSDTDAAFPDNIVNATLSKALKAPILGLAHYEKNDIDQALNTLEGQLSSHSHYSAPDWVAMSHVAISRCYWSTGQIDKASAQLDELERCGYTEGWPRLVAIARWEQIRLATMQGLYLRAEQLMTEIHSDILPNLVEQSLSLPSEIEHEGIAQFRLNIYLDRAHPSLDLLQSEVAHAELEMRLYRVLKLKLLMVIKLHRTDRKDRALALLAEVVDEYVPMGYVRSFADEGRVIVTLLQELAKGDNQSKALAARLLAQCNTSVDYGAENTEKSSASTLEPDSQTLVEPLTQRELEILSLLVAGESNRSIAEKLFVSEATIKWHLGNIYGKLGVKKRTQAMVQAQKLGLV